MVKSNIICQQLIWSENTFKFESQPSHPVVAGLNLMMPKMAYFGTKMGLFWLNWQFLSLKKSSDCGSL